MTRCLEIPLLDLTTRSVELAKGLVAAGIVPAKASEDALHISIATVHFVRIFADLQARQNKRAAEGWAIIPAPTNPPPEPNLALQRTRFAHQLKEP